MARERRQNRGRTRRSVKGAEHAAERFAAGDLAGAEKRCRRILHHDPERADVWHLLAAVALAAHDPHTAVAAAGRALALAPDDADYANTRALALSRDGQREAAEAAWRKLLEACPAHAEAHYNLGGLLLDTARADEALQCFERALELRPDWADAHKNLGVTRFARGDFEGAESAYADAIRCNPRDAGSYRNLGTLKQEADDFESAMTLYRTALDLDVNAETVFRFALLAPIFAGDAQDIATHRGRIVENLRALEATELRLSDPARGVGAPAFYAPYQGADDRPLMEALGRAVTRAWQPPPLPAAAPAARPRIVLVSAHFKRHTLGRLYAPLLERLPRDGYDLAVLSIGAHDDAYARRIEAAADVHVAVPPDLGAARTALAGLGADVVLYGDVGMDEVSYYLAAERFAPVQCVSWGHPVTSGLPNVDYFVSSSLMEPEGAAAHYTETLIELPSWLTLYEAPELEPAPLDAGAFGFGKDERVYLCPQSMFKLHPDFDDYLARILALDPRAVIALIDSRAAWRARLEARFARRIGTDAARIRFVPRQDTAAYLALLSAADVVLDTVHFAGGFTTFETLWLEKPFVTERGRYLRGRVSAALCDLLDLDAPIAAGADDYASRAVRFANDAELRERYVTDLAARKQALLELDDSVLPAHEAVFARLLDEAANSRTRRMAS